MKRVIRYGSWGIGGLIGAVLLIAAFTYLSWWSQARGLMASLADEAPILTANGAAVRDLNKNGTLDVYENANAPLEARVEDLLGQMTVEEKAGMMFINFTPIGVEGELSNIPNPFRLETLMGIPNAELVVGKFMNHASLGGVINDAADFANWHNAMQKMAERTRLGIPVTFATDPRHATGRGASIGFPAGAMSVWPDALGLAAAREPELTRQFADIARQEYRAVGIHLALHPVADLATEPRWPRIGGTFGEDADLSAQLVAAYVEGMQGQTLGPDSVATMVKHFPGGGPQEDGEDPHFEYGKYQVYPGDNFDYHLIPFEDGAFPAGAAQIMPYYGIPVGQTSEDVGFSYNRQIITDMLRNRYQFDGVVCTDWGLISDTKMLGVMMVLPSRSWGVETLTREQRMLKLLDAGIDQFGGEHIPEMLVALVEDGKVAEARLDVAVRRLLRDKFRLGLFDNPYVDVGNAVQVAGRTDFVQAGREAQRRALVLLKNGSSSKPALPLSGRPKIYIEAIDPAVASRYADIVDTPEQADFAIIRLSTPYEPRSGLFESLIRAGDLDFKGDEKARIVALMQTVPTIAAIYLERPAVIPDIASDSLALLADFGAEDDVILDAVFGAFSPSGKLPVELPSSMDAVRAQKEDLPYDSREPVYPFDHGISYETE